jgi:peptide/nickel transport system permease protein
MAAILIIIIVTLVVFLAMRLLPGDPILLYMAQGNLETLTPEQIELARQQFGLDKPLPVQYFNWISDISHGDFGYSMSYSCSIGELLIKRVPITLHLGLLSMVIGTFFGILGGGVSALRRGKTADTVVTLLANVGITVPTFWLGIVLIYLFGLKLGWFPIMGYTSPFTDFWQSTKQLIMPIVCLAVFPLAGIARQTRSSILEVINQDYIRTAWAKGLKESRLVFRHVLKNALIPIVTLSGMQLSHILGGAVLIETVFNIPGMGRLAVDALFRLDYLIVQDIALLTSFMVVLINFLVDISYGWFDPRIWFK